MKRIILSAILIFGIIIPITACRPAYTWRYERVVSPKATECYLRAVLLREEGQYADALIYYDKALAIGGEEKALRAEREEVARLIK